MKLCRHIHRATIWLLYRAKRIFFADAQMVELLIGGIALAWAFGLAHPDDLFSVGNYQYLALVAPEQVWAVWMAIVGTLQIAATFSGQFRLRIMAVMVSTFVWAWIAALFALSAPVTTASGTYAVLALWSAWAWMRISLNRRF